MPNHGAVASFRSRLVLVLRGFSQRVFDGLAECRRVERRVAVEQRLDLVKMAAGGARLDQPPVEHRPHILEILTVASFDLGEGLRVEVIVITGHTAFAAARSKLTSLRIRAL